MSSASQLMKTEFAQPIFLNSVLVTLSSTINLTHTQSTAGLNARPHSKHLLTLILLTTLCHRHIIFILKMRTRRHREVTCPQMRERQEAGLGLKYGKSGSSIHLTTMTLSCLHWSGSLQPTRGARVTGLEQHLSPEQRIPSDSVWQSAASSTEGPQTAAV